MSDAGRRQMIERGMDLYEAAWKCLDESRRPGWGKPERRRFLEAERELSNLGALIMARVRAEATR